MKVSAKSPRASPLTPDSQHWSPSPQPRAESMADGTLPTPVVFLLDVDNTLLNNDRFAADLTLAARS